MCKPLQPFFFNMLYNMLYDMFERFVPGLKREAEHKRSYRANIKEEM